MSDLYDVDFNQQASDLMPPDKRLPTTISFVRALLTSVQWARDLILGSYRTGAIAPNWSPGGYNIYDQVVYNKGVYESLISGNTDIPGTTGSWILIQSNFIGVTERIKFNGQKIVLEYALNKRFGGVFRPPATMSNSDIYISNLGRVPYGFLIGQTIASDVGQTMSSDFIGHPLPFIKINNFQINFKNSLYVLTSDKEIRDFADLYVTAGLKYIIVPY